MDIQVKTDAQSSLITVNGFLKRQDLVLKREYKETVVLGIVILYLVNTPPNSQNSKRH